MAAKTVETPPTTVRSVRAATERLATYERAPGVYEVYSESGTQYIADVYAPACTCPDWQYRSDKLGEDACKHVRRVRFERGEIDIAPLLEAGLDVDPLLLDARAADPKSEEIDGRTHSGGAVATDGGLPEHLTEMSTLDGGAVIHCQSCGAEGDSPETVAHHPNCPDKSEIPADGEQPIVNIETERVFVEINDGGAPISTADEGTIAVRSRSDRLPSEATYLSAHVRFDGEDATVEMFLTEDQITQLREALYEAQWGDEHE